MPDSGVVKYLVKLRFNIEGVVEKADLIGAIFGQTEGLFGPEMNLHELQKTWKVGRIEIELTSKEDKTQGEVIIPMSTDISTAALIAAAVEQVDKVGPCTGKFLLTAIEDVRTTKRKLILDRARTIVKEWASKATSEGEEVLKEVSDSVKRARLVSYGKEALPAGPGVFTADNVYVVEGRADVINLLRAGIENVVAIEGTSIPESIIKLANGKRVIAFLDGDRAGELIARELQQVTRVDRILRAPSGKEVEELTPVEILGIIRSGPTQQGKATEKAVPQELVEKAVPQELVEKAVPQELVEKVKSIYPTISDTLEGELLDEGFNKVARIPVSQLVERLQSHDGVMYVLFDGIITQRLLDACAQASVKAVIGYRKGEITHLDPNIQVYTFRELGLE